MDTDESAGVVMIKKAIKFDNEKRYTEALIYYQEGIELLIDTLKSIQDDRKKKTFKEKIISYMERAEIVKREVERLKKTGEYHEIIEIKENSTGYSYEKVFSRFFKDEVLEYVEIYDPYIKARHQTVNFLRFCEMIVKNSRSIKKINLITTKDDGSNNRQEERLEEIKESLVSRNIELKVEYNPALHDREIKLSNGWIIKIGRGLDYFKAPETRDKLCLGLNDFDLRQCYETKIDIFHREKTKIVRS